MLINPVFYVLPENLSHDIKSIACHLFLVVIQGPHMKWAWFDFMLAHCILPKKNKESKEYTIQ